MPRAKRDLAGIYDWIGAEASEVAHIWYLALQAALRTLRTNPYRCPVAPEDDELRHLLYGGRPHVYRVIYRIDEKRGQVEVLHIRHGARDKFKGEDLR